MKRVRAYYHFKALRHIQSFIYCDYVYQLMRSLEGGRERRGDHRFVDYRMQN